MFLHLTKLVLKPELNLKGCYKLDLCLKHLEKKNQETVDHKFRAGLLQTCRSFVLSFDSNLFRFLSSYFFPIPPSNQIFIRLTSTCSDFQKRSKFYQKFSPLNIINRIKTYKDIFIKEFD